ncbi:MAG: hypothetical protein GF309_03520 [Candidatus Lokiarchaeota archaeon]|nr:hypothetical protein [Candidatus Lokiarchaeota archaeon]
MHRKIVILLLITTLLFQPAPNHSQVTPLSCSHTFAQEEQIHRQWRMNIILVNYESDVLNTELIVQNLPGERIHTVDELVINYTIEYTFFYTNEEYSNQLLSVIDNNSINGSDTGTTINETKLEYQKEHPDEPQRIFYPRAGKSIDAYAVENWLLEHPFVDEPELGYNFYLLNFSALDAEGHSVEHWFDYHDVDPDTGEHIDWFRLEWDNELNPPVAFQYAGFGGRSDLYVLDPSANQWYLRWARIWWGTEPYDSAPEYCTKDLEDKVSEVNLATQAGIDDLSEYLSRYMHDVIGYIHFPLQHSPAKYAYKGTLEALVFSLDTDNGVPVDSIEWVTDAKTQKSHLEEFLPFLEWKTNVSYLDINDYSEWNETFWDHAGIVDGETIVDGYAMFYDIYQNLRYKYVDVYSEQINVFGAVFIKKNMVMHAYGREYTGLGGGGQTAIWKSWERYYRPDGVTPREGVSGVQLHETMHAVGFGHTWSQDHYAGDFSYSPMGYFGMHNGTSVFDQNWVQSTYLDQMEWEHWNRFVNISGSIPENPRPETIEAKEKALAHFEEARELYDLMNWSASFTALENADAWTTRLMYSIFDTEAPEFVNWGVDTLDEPEGGREVWAIVQDDLSGVEEVVAHVLVDNETEYQYDCVKDNSRWTAEIPPLTFEDELTIYLEATDLGMNSVQTQKIRIDGDGFGILEFLLTYPYIVAGAFVVLVFVVFLYRRRMQ